MSISKRIIDLSTTDLQQLQEAILAEIRRRKQVVAPLVDEEAEPPAIIPHPACADVDRKPNLPRRVA